MLATSGLDHDVKIWLPNAEENTCLEGLDKVNNVDRLTVVNHTCLEGLDKVDNVDRLRLVNNILIFIDLIVTIAAQYSSVPDGYF